MSQTMESYRISKTINAPLSYAFKWCTDFSEDDPKITGSNSQRRILLKTKKKVIYAQLYNDDTGQQKIAVDIVTLKPPRSWHLDYYGEEDDETGEYKLTSLGKNSTRLDMTFKEKWKIANPPTRAWQIEHTNNVWDKYISALESDYNSRK
jgi:hypothetical protein